ncbi:MAG: sigma-70 family RNA polymerase sigma factor [Patescibacteria group bacterium]
MVSNRFLTLSFYQLVHISAVVSDFLGAYHKEQATGAKSDEELAKAMQTGDEDAFSELYERYFGKIYAFLVRRVSDAQIAEDLTSDVFMKAFVHRERFVWKPSFSAWIFRIATNRLIDHYRTKPKNASLDIDTHDQPTTLPRADATTDQALLRNCLEGILQKLPEREQLVVGMKYFAEFSPQEIADTLQITTNHVGVILHRALKKCHELYAETPFWKKA